MAEESSASKQPVTLHDLDTWGGELTRRIDGVESRLSGMETRIGGIEYTMSTKDDLQHLRTELVHEFKGAVENITEQLKGANRDEVSALQDAREIHEERITHLEERAGLR